MESLDNLKRQGQQYISKSDEGVCMGVYMGLCDYDIPRQIAPHSPNEKGSISGSRHIAPDNKRYTVLRSTPPNNAISIILKNHLSLQDSFMYLSR